MQNGEITDPPVASDQAAPPLTYAIPRSRSLSPGSDANLFCATCLKNQHLRVASLAQFDVEHDPDHPQYRESERRYFAFKKQLEKTYPQVCEDCRPKAIERLKESSKTAKSDHLRRLLDKSRARSSGNKIIAFSLSGLLVFIGSFLWYGGLLGQLLWNFTSLLQPNLSPMLDLGLSYRLYALEQIQTITTSHRWTWTSLILSILSVWWNPMFRQMNRGFMNHITGVSDWYKYQTILLVYRGFFYASMGDGFLADPSEPQTLAAHLFTFGFVIYVGDAHSEL